MEEIFCKLSSTSPYVTAAMLLQQDGVTEFTWFDLYIKMVAIRSYIKTKLPSIWQDDAKPWKSQNSIEKSRIQDIKIRMNRGGWRCADFVDNFKFLPFFFC